MKHDGKHHGDLTRVMDQGQRVQRRRAGEHLVADSPVAGLPEIFSMEARNDLGNVGTPARQLEGEYIVRPDLYRLKLIGSSRYVLLLDQCAEAECSGRDS